ncbi:hypothetical protein N665_0553s0005 [Sinapis alba]|nr:hypothetical protein N665_0553s0005 [Sinapis alba]
MRVWMNHQNIPTLSGRFKHVKTARSFDEHVEALVLEVEQAVDGMTQDGSPLGDSQTASTSATPQSRRLLLNQEYIKHGQTRNGTICGLGNVQFKHSIPKEPVPVTLKRSLDLEMRVCGLENVTAEIKTDLHSFNSDFKLEMYASRETLNMIMQDLQPQVPHCTASTAPSSQPPAPAPAPAQSQAADFAPVSAQQHEHLTTNDQSDLNRWCSEELGL